MLESQLVSVARVDMEIIGIVENMSGLRCPYCQNVIDVFSTLGGSVTARNANLKLLATLPLELEVVRQGDKGDTSFLDNEQLPITKELNNLVDKIQELSGLDPVLGVKSLFFTI